MDLRSKINANLQFIYTLIQPIKFVRYTSFRAS
jgi:hypothetical protein